MLLLEHVSIPHAMAPKAMAMKAAAMTKGALADALTTEDVKKKHIVKALATLAEIGTAEVKKNGIFVIPGLCRIKTRVKPATKASRNEMFGKMALPMLCCIKPLRPA